MKTIIVLGAAALAFVLAGCTGYTGPKRGIAGTVTGPFGVGFAGVNTTVRDDEKAMGYRRSAKGAIEEMYATWTDGDKNATGMAAHFEAMASLFEKWTLLCAVAKDAEPCGGASP